MSRITGREVASLMEAYSAVYAIEEEKVAKELVEEDVEQLMERGAPTDPKARAAYNANVAKNRAALGNTILYGNAAGRKSAPPSTRNRNVRGDGTIRAGATAPKVVSPKVAPASKFGTTAPKGASVTSTGISGLSGANRAAYSAGGGNAAAQRGMGQTTSQVIAQGKANLARMDQGKPAPVGAKPTSKPAAAAPAAKPASAPAAAAPAAKPASAPAAAPATAAPKLSKMQQDAKDLRDMRAASQQRQASMLKQDFDMFDVVLEYLVAEGYAETNEAALAIMANMSESWKESILEADSIEAMRARAAKRRQQRYGKQGGGGRDDFRPYTKDDYDNPKPGYFSPSSQAKDA